MPGQVKILQYFLYRKFVNHQSSNLLWKIIFPLQNYKFLDYKGSSYSGSNSVAYDKDIAGCRAGSNDSSDDYGLAIISRGEVLDSALI